MSSPLNPILIVDDDRNDVELILTAFRETNLANEIIVAHDGEEAMDFFYRRGRFASRDQRLPAVVLLDLKMPRMGGREVLRLIREDPALRMVPVVVLTSSREEQDLYETYKLGANSYVVKPVGFQNFVASVGKLGFFWALLNEVPPPEPSNPDPKPSSP